MKKILFVCVENSCRSQIAEAITNTLYSKKFQAWSAGSAPSNQVNPKAIKSLEELGIIHSGHPQAISDFFGYKFDYIIGMGCGDACPIVDGAKNLEWNIPDPKDLKMQEFNEVRDLIHEQIRGLDSLDAKVFS